MTVQSNSRRKKRAQHPQNHTSVQNTMKSHPPERQYDTILHCFHALHFYTAQLLSLFMHKSTVVTSATEYYLTHCNPRFYRNTLSSSQMTTASCSQRIKY
jgi:hypothetical protein